MTCAVVRPHEVDLARALSVLADGIIPADERDAGAAAVDAGRQIATSLDGGARAALYHAGLRSAWAIAADLFGRDLTVLSTADAQMVVERLATDAPAFFRQLRSDVTILYLSDPAVLARIGFPGPSIETGGYEDFDQPQKKRR